MANTTMRLVNSMTKALLKSPLHGILSGGVMLITFTGRKSGKTYTTPVEYQRDGDTVIFFTQKERVWWKNLRGGAPVTLRLRGKDLTGTATPDEDLSQADLIAALKARYTRLKDDKAADFAAKMLRISVTLDAD